MSSAEGDFDQVLAEVGSSLDRLGRRLRSLSPLAWRSRRSVVDLSLHRLAVMAATAESGAAHPVPTISEHALGDALDVIANDALVAIAESRDPHLLRQVRDELAALLDATR